MISANEAFLTDEFEYGLWQVAHESRPVGVVAQDEAVARGEAIIAGARDPDARGEGDRL